MRKIISVIVATIATAGLGAAAAAAEHEVKMLNKGSDGQMMVFEPAYLEIAPGDTVTFVPTDLSHNAESIPALTPAGGETFNGSFNKEVSVTLTKEGLYGVKCLPHYAMGMVALIKVGGAVTQSDATAFAKQPPFAKKRMQALLASLQ